MSASPPEHTTLSLHDALPILTRDTDIEIAEDEAEDLLKSVEEEVRKRRFGEAVRLEVQKGMPPTVRDALRKGLDRSEEHTSELQSRLQLVCRLLLEKKKKVDK